MNDRRLILANTRVAHVSLRGRVQAQRFAHTKTCQVVAPVAPLLQAPRSGADRDRELAFGEGFDMLDSRDGWAFGAARRDGYVGYISASQLSERALPPTHRVISPSYYRAAPRLKSTCEPACLPIGARVSVCATHRDHCDWAEIDWPSGDPKSKGSAVFVPMPHLAPLASLAVSPVNEAERYLGVPYLWAGNSGFGIDCSGLVQAALLACAIPCPGDSDQQASAFAPATGPYQSGDLLFWKGHVAMVTDPVTLIHANAHHMTVAHEPIANAISRIQAQGDGPVIAHTRPTRELQT